MHPLYHSLGLWNVFILINVTQNVMSSFVRIGFNSYEVILYVISIEEIIQPKVGQASECVVVLVLFCFGQF
jgi:hypothetical protein